jgi:uncharacterized protein
MNRRSLLTLAAIALALLVAFAINRRTQRKIPLRIATGQRGGTFLPLGQSLASAFVADNPRLSPTVLESPGSNASVEMIERGEVDIALVSSNSRPGEHVNLIVPLYMETLQIVVRRSANIATPGDLAGKKVSIGPSGSGTETIAWQVMQHFGLARDKVQAQNITLLEAVDALEKGTLDAAFIVSGVRASAAARLLSRNDMDLLSLGDPDRKGSALEGIGVDAPYLIPAVIPEFLYGSVPAKPVGTIGVRALLVARKDLDEDLVHDLAQSLFAAKVKLAEKEQMLARLTEKFDPAESPFPLHPGADRFFRRDEPSLIARYSDQISLAITVGALLWSAFAALRAWRRSTQKGRIETYFEHLAALTLRVREASSDDDRAATLKDIRALEARALGELAAERLEAGPAFRVLQEGLRTLEDDVR